MPRTFIKDPDEVLEYVFNFSDQMAEDADALTGAATITITPADGLALDSQAQNENAVTVWLINGIDKTNYGVECDVDTVGGRKYSRTMTVKVRPK